MFAPIAWLLAQIVAHDYRLRIAGKRPDRMHWADSLLLRIGYSTDETGKLHRWAR
jgi:hypothetical protein